MIRFARIFFAKPATILVFAAFIAIVVTALAARTLGMRDSRIILTQILPNALPLILVVGSMMVGSAILTESALSFLGLGDPNLLSWGSMIGGARSAMWVAWWTSVLPGLAIMATVLSLNFIGDRLNDTLNPRRQR